MTGPGFARGPECVDPPGRQYQTWFALWRRHENGLSVSFSIWKVPAWDGQGRNLFVKKDTGEMEDLDNTSLDPLECEPRITGFRKWDGCTQWNNTEQDRILHIDDMEEFEFEHQAMRNVFRICAEMMGDKWDGGEK